MVRPRIPMTEETKRRLARENQQSREQDLLREQLRLREEKAKKYGADHKELAHIFHDQQKTRGRLVSDGITLHQYDTCTNTWALLSKQQKLKEISELSRIVINGKSVTMTAQKCDSVYRLFLWECLEEGFFRDRPRGLNLRNGFLRMSDGIPQLEEWHPNQRATSALDLDYNPEADTTAWYRLLYTIFDAPSSHDDAKKRADFLGEFVGACLFGYAPDYSKCAILLGGGSNGKSTLMAILKEFFPKNSVTSVVPQDWHRPYNAILLKDKMLNLVEEFPTRVLKNGSVFKSVVTGETINGRHPYERLQTFEPRCGHLIACNELPYNFDFSHGFVRRCVIVPFDHVFSSGMTKEQVVASMRPHYPGILRWAVEGAQRLLQNGAYTVPPSSSEAVDVWESDSNSIAQWYNLFCIGDESKYVPSTKEWISSTKIYTVYVLWAKKHGLPTLSHTLFGRHLAKRGLAKKRNKSARLYGLTERLT